MITIDSIVGSMFDMQVSRFTSLLTCDLCRYLQSFRFFNICQLSWNQTWYQNPNLFATIKIVALLIIVQLWRTVLVVGPSTRLCRLDQYADRYLWPFLRYRYNTQLLQLTSNFLCACLKQSKVIKKQSKRDKQNVINEIR